MADRPPSEDPTSSSSTPTNTPITGNDFLPSTTFLNRFKNFYRMATGTMSAPGAAAYWADADTRYSASDCNRCEKYRDHLLAFSPIVRYMSDNIRSLGGDLNKSNIRCRTCKTGMLGGFDHRYGIILCANFVDRRNMMEDVLAHEMVHAYDHLRFQTKLDHESSLKETACSEIRASNLSGECRWANEFFRNKIMAFTTHHQDCVKRRAVHSVKMRPNCKDEATAMRVVDEVWGSCFRDTRPFDEIYR
jgi:mitochondrial inner membrane protease ATP23